MQHVTRKHKWELPILLIAGEEPAAMQHGSKSDAVRIYPPWSYGFLAALCFSLLLTLTCCGRRDER
jgi:hypothetical protein